MAHLAVGAFGIGREAGEVHRRAVDLEGRGGEQLGVAGGELGLLLQALGEWWAAARPVLTSPDAAAAGNLVTFATVVGGVLKFFRDKGGRKIKDRTFNDQGQVESHLDDGSTLVSNVEVAEAADHPRVQGAVKEVIAPLAYLGIDTVSIETVNLTVNINSEEARRIPDPEPEADPTRTTVRYEAWASFNRPHFGGTKWGVLLPGKSFQAFIEDGTFLAEVEAGNVSLNAYDEFRVVVREEPYVTAGGQRRIHRYVERVLERREPERGSDAERTLPEEDEGAA